MRNDALFTAERDNYQIFQCIINKKNYIFRASLVNADGYYVSLQKDAILDLYLRDVITNPFLDGYITIDNTEDVIERYKFSPVAKEFSTNSSTNDEVGYRTRGDGRDILYLSIIPVDPPSSNPYSQQNEKYNSVFGFQYVFILSDEMDIDTPRGKAKKYRIKDIDREILKETKIFFTTSSLVNSKNVAFLSDTNRKVFTGDAMKAILNNTLGNVVKTDANNTTPNFESGASRIFYSSPNDNTALDDLNYIYDYHVSNSSARDFSFLLKDRYTGEYTLESVSSMFSKAFNPKTDSGGQYFVENITITGASNTPSNVIQNDIKKPLYAIELGETSDIINVKFFNTPGEEYQDRVVSTLVHNYNFDTSIFSVNEVDGDIQNVKKDFTAAYVTPMKGKNNSPSPNFIINNTQKTNLNFKNEYLLYVSDNDYLKYAVGRNKVLKDALMLNLGVEIILQGGFQRYPGSFISIDRQGTYIDNDFDRKFLGLYYILEVDHQFIDNDKFINKIIAVKTYHFIDPKFNENIS